MTARTILLSKGITTDNDTANKMIKNNWIQEYLIYVKPKNISVEEYIKIREQNVNINIEELITLFLVQQNTLSNNKNIIPEVFKNNNNDNNKNNNDNNDNETIDKLNNKLFSYIDENIDDELNCKICFNYLLYPMTLECCDNTFCNDCLINLESCPMCKFSPLKTKTASRIVNNMLDKLKVKCIICNEVYERLYFLDHYNNYCSISCPLGCQKKLSRKMLNQHLEECDKKIVSCISSYCSFTCTKEKMNCHIQDCIFSKLNLFINSLENKINLLNEIISTQQHQIQQLMYNQEHLTENINVFPKPNYISDEWQKITEKDNKITHNLNTNFFSHVKLYYSIQNDNETPIFFLDGISTGVFERQHHGLEVFIIDENTIIIKRLRTNGPYSLSLGKQITHYKIALWK